MKQHLYILTGASRGLGLGMARQLLTAGHSLLCIARHRNDELGLLAGSTPQCTLEQWTADLGDGGAAVAARLHDWLMSLDADTYASITLINNAAVLPRIAPLADASSADIASVLRVGLEAPMQLTAAFLRATAGWSAARRVLNISSGNGRRAMASQSLYSAAKAGMDHYTLPRAGRRLTSERRPSLFAGAGHHRYRHADPSAQRRRRHVPGSCTVCGVPQ